MAIPALNLMSRLYRRELANRFKGSLSGGLWALLQPVLQLAITAFVFVHVFKIRVPAAETTGYVTFLAVAMWPWMALSEGLLRSTTAITDNAALIGKVAMPREALVVASVAASFTIHLAGYLVVLLVLWSTGQGVHLAGIVPAALLYVPLAAMTLGAGLAFAAIQIFVRDLAQILAQVLPLLMFGAPVYYDRSQLSERAQAFLGFNPFTFYAESARALLTGHGVFDVQRLAIAVLVAVAVLAAGHAIFRRLNPHFEDFL